MDHLTGNPAIDQWISLLGALVPVASMVAGILNQRIRNAPADGLSPLLLNAVGLLNIFAVNFDKAMQLMRMARELRSSVAAPAVETSATAVETSAVETSKVE